MLGGAVDLDVAFIGVGCNRVVGAIAWGPCNLVAFAAHHSVAVFDPKVRLGRRDRSPATVVFEFCGFGWVVGLVLKP